MKPDTTRRGFLEILIAAGGAITGLAMAIPGLMYLWPAAKGAGAKLVEVKGADQLALGQSTKCNVGGKPVIVVRQRTGIVAFSASCTHLGCLIEWDAAGKHYRCPCHAAVFDENGDVVSGPAPAPLPPFGVKEVDGKVFVFPISQNA